MSKQKKAAGNISETELRRRLELARLSPMTAHMPHVGLVLRPGQAGPVCELCGGTNAPIVGGKHINPERWCKGGKYGQV